MEETRAYYKNQVDVYLEEIKSNKNSLRQAIAQEKYEQAAILRDQLKEKQKNFIHFLANMDLSEPNPL
jgi:protein-arginine kinase activator protein McsA